MASTNIKVKGLKEVQTILAEVKNGAKRVITRAINKSLTTTRAKEARIINEGLTAKIGDIKKYININKASYDKMQGSVIAKGSGLPIGIFKYKKVQQGIAVKIKKKSNFITLKHAHESTMKTGHKGIFWRTTPFVGKGKPYNPMRKYGRLPRQYRFPIKELYTTGIPDYLQNKDSLNQIYADAKETLDKNIQSELNYELSKLR